MKKDTICTWFGKDAREAARFYAATRVHPILLGDAS
jgi:predicted 3-demethylubiquinone-9 3-methyltransferase (glyoxalase superfamily)